jgi:acyl carrier protein
MVEPKSVEQVLQVVNDTLVSEFELDRATITAQARMREDLGMDSLDGVDLIVALEKALGVQIPEDIARQMKTVGDIYAYVQKAAAEKTAAAG